MGYPPKSMLREKLTLINLQIHKKNWECKWEAQAVVVIVVVVVVLTIVHKVMRAQG